MLPTGTVTFLFTDIKGSTPLWEHKPEAMKSAIARHHAILRQSIEEAGGVVFKIIGDSFQSAFPLASLGVIAALEAQRAFLCEPWKETGALLVRMGLHTGPAELEGDARDYAVSHTLNRVARITTTANGGQILLSQETAGLAQRDLPADISLRDLGEHRLKGMSRPEHIYQVIAPDLPQDFPPLSSEIVNPLLATKLHIPDLRRDLLPRPRLVKALDEAVAQGCRLILVSAPAGFGKTTLVAEWAFEGMQGKRSTPFRFAWLSLDSGDNDPLHFWRYVIAALQTVEPSAGLSAQAALGAAQSEAGSQSMLEPLISSLLNDLACQSPGLVLVLDDYHVIESEVIHNSLSYLLDRLPSCLAITITTRADPPLALSRRRARGQLYEARITQLRFTRQEIDSFLSTAGLRLPEGDLAALEHRTEGWIAGLQLALMSLREADDQHAFITAFAGDDRFVMDYLLEEVLQRLPSRLHEFLLHTSILDRLSGGLCDAVLGREKTEDLIVPKLPSPLPGSQSQSSQEILEILERSNLFIMALDSRRSWYRYHPLFQDLLRNRLRLAVKPGDLLALYRRACAWYEKEGLSDEAINLALAAPDYETAAGLMERHILDFFYRSETLRVHTWLKALPESMLRAHPLLCAIFACSIALAPPYPPLSTQVAETWLEAARKALIDAGNDDSRSTQLARGFIPMFRAYLTRFEDRPLQEAIQQSLQALDLLPPEGDPSVDINFMRMRSALLANLGISYWLIGDETSAERTFHEAIRVGVTYGDLFNALAAATQLTRIPRLRGQLRKSEALSREILRSIFGDEDYNRLPPYGGMVAINLGFILLEWNRLDEAERILKPSIEVGKLTMGGKVFAEGFLAYARLKFIRGDYIGALDQLDQAIRHWNGATEGANAQRALFWLALSKKDPSYLPLVESWSRGRRLEAFSQDPYELNKEVSIALLRVMITGHASAREGILFPFTSTEFPAWLESQAQAMQERGWLHWVIELRIIQTLFWQAQGNQPQALDALRNALILAEPGDYLRIFLNDGVSLAPLLKVLRDKRQPYSAYAGKLAAAIAAEEPPAEAEQLALALIEPLTSRELEVLHLLSNGYSNAQIAQELVISTNTAKKHVLHIMEKLGASSRARAIALARELKIIP
jgi:LuxR family transcriptional regulator, maltose regulon positive regulatory protein